MAVEKTPRKRSTTTRKASAPKPRANGSPRAGRNGTALPTALLDGWLAQRQGWDHQDWLGLLDQLRAAGHATLTETEDGRTRIGEYLETHRR